jgi:hypothetical protein
MLGMLLLGGISGFLICTYKKEIIEYFRYLIKNEKD